MKTGRKSSAPGRLSSSLVMFNRLKMYPAQRSMHCKKRHKKGHKKTKTKGRSEKGRKEGGRREKTTCVSISTQHTQYTQYTQGTHSYECLSFSSLSLSPSAGSYPLVLLIGCLGVFNRLFKGVNRLFLTFGRVVSLSAEADVTAAPPAASQRGAGGAAA